MFRFSVLSLALAAALPAYSADLPRYAGETTVVTATRTPSEANLLASDVTVISAADIAKSGVTDLPALLARQPGVAIAQTGGPGQPASLFMRGANSNYTVLLIDGQRASSATTGTAAWQMIPLEMIERIEIVRGGASGAYGADAIGGVVQIFTKRGGGKPHATASVEYGSNDHKAVSAGVGGSADNWRYQFTVKGSEDNGIDATAPNHSQYESDRDGSNNAAASGSLAYFINENHEVGAQLLYSNSRTEFDAGGLPAFPVTQNRMLNYSVYARDSWFPGWESTLRAGESRDWSKADGWDWNNFVAGVDYFETRQQQLSWNNRLDTRTGKWLLGAETLEDSVRSSVQYDKPTRRTNAVLAGWSHTLGIHSAQVNLRHDNNSQFGGFNSGNVGYSVEVRKDLRLYANVGRAYHAPTFNDLYYPASMWFAPNPNLKPERARTAEVGIKSQLGGWQINTAVFETRINDLIASTGSTMENVGTARIKGVTLSTEGKIAEFEISGNLTWQDPRDQDKDTLLVRRARTLGSAKVAYPLGSWKLLSELTGQGTRYDSQKNTEASRMHGYVLTHLGADYQIDKNWKWSVRVNNVFDQPYALAKDFSAPYVDYSTEGRTGLLKLTWQGDLR